MHAFVANSPVRNL